MKVPFLDLSIQHEQIKEEVKRSLDKIYKESDFILGKELKNFEEAFGGYVGTKYAIGVNSGTDALFLALKALSIQKEDEVIVPAFTYIASAFAISYTGAVPVFCDIDEDTYNIDPVKIEEKISSKTKAIMAVHLYGQPADMDPILEIAEKHNLKVIEDCAQAHGATYRSTRINTDKTQRGTDREQRVGSIGDVGCFSFYPSKNLGAYGDGGMVVTNNEQIKNKLHKLRDYGRSDKYHHDKVGYNSRLDTVQAAVLKAKLKRLDKWNNLRIKSAQQYDALLKDTQGIITPARKDYVKHVYHIYAIRVKNNNIDVIVHYPIPCHLQQAYKNLKYKQSDFSVSEKVASSIISLPIFPYIKEEQIEYVTEIIKQAV
jgi:dTDP-4-amino-4,6-dideoxygalactose transaminase